MKKNELHLELLLSMPVIDQDGKTIGRIEEVHGEEHNKEIVIKEFLLGPHALMERFSAWVSERQFARLFGMKPKKEIKIPWNKIDLTNLKKPRFIGSKTDL